MPRPLLFLCAERLILDRQTGLSSAIDIVEKIMFERAATEIDSRPAIQLLPVAISAIWLREESDPVGVPFEYEFLFRFSNGNREDMVGEGTFQFGEHRRHRLTMHARLSFDKPGVFTPVCRIRLQGTDDWISQEFPIDIVEKSAIEEPSYDDSTPEGE